MKCTLRGTWLGSLALLLQLHAVAGQTVPYLIPDFKPEPPRPPPAYMVDNTRNTHGAAPDRSLVNGPAVKSSFVADVGNLTHLTRRQDPGFWVAGVTHGQSPYADVSNYKVYRNVMDYGAKGNGVDDDTQAINDAIVDGMRCGESCGSTSTLGALIYFPKGTYMVSTPIIQYYYTQFVGDANAWPTIMATSNFTGIAVIDTDVYIPGGNGAEWYINQNQFYRSIRNFNIDITNIPNNNTVNGQEYVPTCLHWQVSQSTSLQNIHFIMIQNSDKQVGIFMENGSGGFLSDLNFYGGQIGFRSGSQQFTMRGLTFYNVATAVSMIWDWGIITIYNAYVAFDTQSFGGIDGQGTGSLVIQDNYWSAVSYGITLRKGTVSSALVIDNLKTVNCGNIVMNSGYADPILAANSNGEFDVANWALGYQYTNMSTSQPTFTYGNVDPAPSKPAALLNSNEAYFTRSRPQYESLTASQIINVLDHGVVNDGTGDQTDAINSVLSGNVGSLIFFPAGVYTVEGTVVVPLGSKITGELWPQIMATGAYFQNEKEPKVMFQVGNVGESGIMEISGMLFTVKGPTAGAILVEWNVAQSTQGSAAMWDSHFRIGGAAGSSLSLADCPKTSTNANCKAANLLLHVTRQSSAYFENVWAWTADHDLDASSGTADTTTSTQISVFTARGILVESQGPTWFYGSASEHHQLYQYQLSGAKNVYLGHMQTETPYYQPSPNAMSPYTTPSLAFANDPVFEDCVQGSNSSCTEAWALRVLNSTNVFIYGAGFYSFFTDYTQDCLSDEGCQQRLIDIGYTQGLWMYNVFTKGATEVISPQGGITPIFSTDTQAGFTTEVAVYVAFALSGADIGGRGGSDSNTPDNVSILPLPGCTTVAPGATFTLAASCISAITSLPSTGPDASQQNQPPGPDICHEVCDIWRLLTGTCCGKGGSVGNPIYIPPNVTLPYDIPLPSGYTPPANITIPIPGYYDPGVLYGTQTPPPTSTPTTTGSSSSTTYGAGFATGSPGDPGCTHHECGCIPAGTPIQIFGAGIGLAAQIVLPGGSCFPGGNGGGGGINPPSPCNGCPPGGITLPPGFSLPPVDPPCFGSDCAPCQVGACPDGDSNGDNGEDGCDPDLSTETGLCPNGNFPLYDPSSNTISCDVPDAEVPFYLSECQEDADNNEDFSIQEIECEVDSCPMSSKRSIQDQYMFLESTDDSLFNFTKRQQPPTKKPRTCPPTPPANEPGTVNPGRSGQCDVVFECDTDLWPNVCNNAASAQAAAPTGRGKSNVLTYMGPGARQDYVTQQWWRTHAKLGNVQEHVVNINNQRSAGSLPGQPFGGWGLVGCEVEEYPFGNSITNVPQNQRGIWNNRAVLRLIPWEENRSHGNALGKFIANAIKGDPNRNLPALSATGGWTYCVDITGNGLDSTNFLLTADQSKNRCGQAYGPGYLLVNDISAGEARQYPMERKWDPWFDNNNQLFEHTVYSSGQSIATMSLPSQYGKFPAPGQKTFIRDGSGNSNSGKWSTAAANGVLVGSSVAPGVPGRTGQNLKYDTPGVTHAGILRRSIDIEDLGYDPRYIGAQRHEITAVPTPKDTRTGRATSTTPHTPITPAPVMPRRHLDKVPELRKRNTEAIQGSPNVARAINVLNKPEPNFISHNSTVLNKSERFFKRQASQGGSFLDVNVYQKALGCSVPYEDPCEIADCFEGGVVYNYDGTPASSGSADQSGSNGEDTGDNGNNGGNPPGTTTTPTGSPSSFPTVIVEIEEVFAICAQGAEFCPPDTQDWWAAVYYIATTSSEIINPAATQDCDALTRVIDYRPSDVARSSHYYPSTFSLGQVGKYTDCSYIAPSAPTAGTGGYIQCPNLCGDASCPPITASERGCASQSGSPPSGIYDPIAQCTLPPFPVNGCSQ